MMAYKIKIKSLINKDLKTIHRNNPNPRTIKNRKFRYKTTFE